MAEVFTEQQYKTLCAAIAQGALRVKYGDKEVDYRSLDEMRQIKSMMETALGLNKKVKKRKFISFSKGFN